VRARIGRWILNATLTVALTLGGTMLATIPAHAQLINALGQAGQQVNRCQFGTLDDRICGASTYGSGGTGWQLSTPVVEPAVGVAPAVCRRGVENE
jgi:hypothetical protein